MDDPSAGRAIGRAELCAFLERLARIVTEYKLDYLEVDGVRIGKTTHEHVPTDASGQIDPADPYGSIVDDEQT